MASDQIFLETLRRDRDDSRRGDTPFQDPMTNHLPSDQSNNQINSSPLGHLFLVRFLIYIHQTIYWQKSHRQHRLTHFLKDVWERFNPATNAVVPKIHFLLAAEKGSTNISRTGFRLLKVGSALRNLSKCANKYCLTPAETFDAIPRLFSLINASKMAINASKMAASTPK